MRSWLVIGVVTCASQACAAEPPSRTKEGDASSEAGADAATFEGRVFEAGAPINCVSTNPRTTPIDPGLNGMSCLFEVSPPLLGGEVTSYVVIDGVLLPSSQYEVHGYDVLELTGVACEDYRDGKIGNVAVEVACPAY